MKQFLLLSILIISVSCSSKSIKDEDIEAWIGQPYETLQRHPFFSTLPQEIRSDPDSPEQIINFSQKKSVETGGQTCLGTGFGFSNVGIGSSFCSPREFEERSCIHQFFIKNNKIMIYRLIGEKCSTDCKMRPSEKCS